MQGQGKNLQAVLAQLGAVGVDPAQVAEHALRTWRSVAAALSPVIGQRAVAALYLRSVYVIRDDHPWMMAVREKGAESDDFSSLRLALSQQSSSNAAAAHAALLHAFVDLLTHLIGEALTERLLKPLLDNSSGNVTVQEI